ncbi:MAG TPA: hypothetical protein VIY48_10235 [Candidatus Paceibacterota bacterium]
MESTHPPLYETLGEVAGVWIIATLGYYTVLPILGFSLSYNNAPFIIATYFFIWFLIATTGFRSVLRALLFENRLWVYAATILAMGIVLPALLVQLSQLPIPYAAEASRYSDLFFATPWYFLPKVADILLQQTLVATIILALSEHIRSIKNISLAYAALFGGAHVVLFMLSDAPTAYAAMMTGGAILSAAAFPYLILKVRNGFVYTFSLHLLFYLLLVLVLHTWPPVHVAV